MHVSRQRQAAHQGQGAKAIHDVVNVESVSRTETVTRPGEGAVEGVAQPIQPETDDHREERVAVPRRQGVERPRSDLCREAQHGQVVGTNSIRSAHRQPQKCAFFRERYPAFLHSNHIRKRMAAAHLEEHARVYLLTEFGHRFRTNPGTHGSSGGSCHSRLLVASCKFTLP